MRPTSPRATFGQQNPTGGYPPGGQGGVSGQYGKSIKFHDLGNIV